MKFEHFGINVPDSRAMAKWYAENLDMQVVRSGDKPPYVRFIADSTGRVIIEIYTNTDHPIPDYASQHPSWFHIAVAADDPSGIGEKLVSKGAEFQFDETLEDGSYLVMLRDPWSIPLQLAKRSRPM